jgi:PiT family inorganic phosphate transporter
MEVALALTFALAFTNGFHDAANAIATLVATRGATPRQAIALSAVFNVLGALLVGTAVADTVAGIVDVPPPDAVAVIGSAALAAVAWNVLTWRLGLPSSSGHALLGGLAGAALAGAGAEGVNWDGLTGVIVALAVSPLAGLVLGFAVVHVAQRVLRRATRAVERPIRGAEWAMSAALSFAHGANDGQKAMGLVAALLLATGHLDAFGVPLWVKLASAIALTIGTALGGWRIVRTIGRGIIHLSPLDGFASQSGSSAVILAASYAGAPVSTTHVVASSIVGAGVGRRRWRHVHWQVVRSIGLAWVTTLPATAALAALTLPVWRAVA